MVSNFEWTACHELGHAIVAEIVKPGSLVSVTVIPDPEKNSAGVTTIDIPEADRDDPYQVIIAIAGSVATKLVYNQEDNTKHKTGFEYFDPYSPDGRFILGFMVEIESDPWIDASEILVPRLEVLRVLRGKLMAVGTLSGNDVREALN